MAKSKTSPGDFARFLEDSDEPAAFARPAVGQIKSETSNKPTTKWQQTDNNQATEPTTKWQQTDNKIELTTQRKAETGNKVDTELATLSATNRQQSGNKPTTKTSFSSLVGLQRALVVFLYESCKVSRSRSTDSLTLEHISASLKTRSGSAKTTLQRLEAKGCIHRVEFKNGRSGWSKYQLPESIYAELLQTETSNKLTTKWQQTDNKVGTEPATELATSPSSSSRDLNIKESTTTQPVDFSNFDLSAVQHLGITASVLARCVELYPVLVPEQLEVLVLRFAEFAKDPKNKVQNARGFFISLAEQASKGQVPLDHIETPDERLMRLFLQSQERAKANRVDYEQKVLAFECETWLESLDAEARLAIVPESSILRAGSAAHVAMLRKHFADNVWPSRRQAILETEPAAVATP